jgi:hypothetical protein
LTHDITMLVATAPFHALGKLAVPFRLTAIRHTWRSMIGALKAAQTLASALGDGQAGQQSKTDQQISFRNC